MALSEREQRLLEEMERGFYASEADVVSTGAPRQISLNYRALAVGALVVLVGLGALIAAVALAQIWLGVVGFGIMTFGVTHILSKGTRGSHTAGDANPGSGSGGRGDTAGPGSKRAERAPRESLTEKLERRWDERMNGER